MNKREFTKQVAKNFPQIKEISVIRMCDIIFDTIIENLQNGGRVELRYFGTFFLRHYSTRLSRNPRTGEMIEVYAKSIPRFRPGRKLSEKATRFAQSSHR